MNRNANTLKKIEDYGKNSLQPELQTTYQNAKKVYFTYFYPSFKTQLVNR